MQENIKKQGLQLHTVMQNTLKVFVQESMKYQEQPLNYS